MSEKSGNQKAVARGALAIAGTMLALMVAGVAWTGSATAQVDPYATETPTVLPTIIRTAEPERTVDPEVILGELPPPAERPTRLPITGADLTLFVGTGLAAIATGMLIVRRTRARRAEK